jgi:hypothetical protein
MKNHLIFLAAGLAAGYFFAGTLASKPVFSNAYMIGAGLR